MSKEKRSAEEQVADETNRKALNPTAARAKPVPNSSKIANG
jgi:hypothetical protein